MSSFFGKKTAFISDSFNHGFFCFKTMVFPSYLADAYTFSHFNLAFQTADSFMRFQYKPEKCSFLQQSRYLLHFNIHSVLNV